MVLDINYVRLGLESTDKMAAIRFAGSLLVEGGYVEHEYIEAMVEREEDLSTYIGKSVAIPHGVGHARKYIKQSGLVVLQYPKGILFDGEIAHLIIGIAGLGNEHLSILANLATLIDDGSPEMLEKMFTTDDPHYIYDLFTKDIS